VASELTGEACNSAGNQPPDTLAMHLYLSPATATPHEYFEACCLITLYLTEGESVQFANLCVLCNLLHMHSSAVDLLAPDIGAF